MTLWHHLRWQLIGSANVSTLVQPMRSSISSLMHTLLSSVTDNMFDELWSEINDMPGEIFDIPEMKDLQEDDNKSLEDFLKSNNDF